jgi:hypothetical protein
MNHVVTWDVSTVLKVTSVEVVLVVVITTVLPLTVTNAFDHITALSEF